MHNNKAQITLFIILGLVILISFLFLFFLLIETVDDEITLEKHDDLENVAFAMDNCLNNIFEEEVYNLLKHHLFTGPYEDELPLLVKGSFIHIVDFDDLETMFKENILLSYQNNCLPLFDSYEEYNIFISVDEDVNINFNSESVSVDFGTVNIEYLDSTLAPSFSFVEYLDIERYYSFLFVYASLEAENPGFFDIGALLISSFLYDLAYEVVHKEDKLALIDLYDLEDNFILSFGVGYE